MPELSSKNQITLPVEAMRAAGLRAGEEVTVRPGGDGELIIAARGSRAASFALPDAVVTATVNAGGRRAGAREDPCVAGDGKRLAAGSGRRNGVPTRGAARC